MGKVVHRRPDGTLLIELKADEAGDLDVGARVDVRRADGVIGEAWPEAFFDGLTGDVPAITPADIAAARSDVWSSASR
jgi:hypothetical protein